MSPILATLAEFVPRELSEAGSGEEAAGSPVGAIIGAVVGVVVVLGVVFYAKSAKKCCFAPKKPKAPPAAAGTGSSV